MVFGMTENVHYLPGQAPKWTTGERLRKIRRDRSMTQAQFAEMLQVTESAYEAWESGRNSHRDLPSLAEQIEMLTGVPRAWLLGWMDGPTGPSGGESGRRDSNSQHSAWNVDSSEAHVIAFPARETAPAEPLRRTA